MLQYCDKIYTEIANNIQTIVISKREATFNFKIDSARNQKAKGTFYLI